MHKTACAVSFGTCIMAIYATQSPRYASECFGSKMLPLFQTRASRVIRSGETCRQITHRCHVGRGVLQTHHVSCLRMFVVDFNQGGLEGEAFVGIYEQGTSFGENVVLSDNECFDGHAALLYDDDVAACADRCKTMKAFSVLGCMSNILAVVYTWCCFPSNEIGGAASGCMLCLKSFAGWFRPNPSGFLIILCYRMLNSSAGMLSSQGNPWIGRTIPGRVTSHVAYCNLSW